jgi:hypothetical protein
MSRSAIFRDTHLYSFVVFLHTVFETNLRGFSAGEQRARSLPIGLTDLAGSVVGVR